MIYLRWWYRRVEPSVEFYCDLDYDPFLFMQENNKKYGKRRNRLGEIIY